MINVLYSFERGSELEYKWHYTETAICCIKQRNIQQASQLWKPSLEDGLFYNRLTIHKDRLLIINPKMSVKTITFSWYSVVSS